MQRSTGFLACSGGLVIDSLYYDTLVVDVEVEQLEVGSMVTAAASERIRRMHEVSWSVLCKV